MSTTATATATMNQSRGGGRGRGGRGGNRGKGRGRGGSGNRGGAAGSQTRKNEEEEKSPAPAAIPEPKTATEPGQEQGEEDEEAVCWICAEPVKYYSVSECNHRTCHVCALRLRALYKKKDCTFCKEPQPLVIFTTSENQPFSEYNALEMPYKDDRLSIIFETQEMMEETLILLRFNCPDTSCDYIAKGWGDLKLHVRAGHNKLLCDLCIRLKKVFSHEHALYTYTQLTAHLPSMNRRNQKQTLKEEPEGGIHPLCEFCRECFFSGDELYSHMRERHEECFICKRNGVRDQYFQDYANLEHHFNTIHHPCTHPTCLAQKFVVFNTALDLQAHNVETHGADMSARDKRDARRVLAEFDFDFEEVPGAGRSRGSGGGGRGGARNRERDREPPPPPQQAPTPARPPGPGRRREGFGAALTVEPGGPSNTSTSNGGTPRNGVTPQGPSRRNSPSPPPRGDVDPAVLDRHTQFLNRLASFSPNPSSAIPVVKSAIRSYRANESSARDLISTIWNVLDRHLEQTASIVNSLVDLLGDDEGEQGGGEEKRKDLLASWRGFEVEQRRQFPDLVPVPSSSSSSGGYAAITSGRVLNAKQSTNTRPGHKSRAVWDRVAQAAGSSPSSSSGPSTSQQKQQRPPDRFPPLRPGAAGPAKAGGQRKTPWVNPTPTPPPQVQPPPPPQQIFSVPGPSASSTRSKAGPPPKLSNAAFPELPSAGSTKAQKPPVSGNQSLRNILGISGAAPAAKAWGAGGGGGTAGGGGGEATNTAGNDNEDAEQAPSGGGGGGKKKKGKQKQTLFTLGSFPT